MNPLTLEPEPQTRPKPQPQTQAQRAQQRRNDKNSRPTPRDFEIARSFQPADADETKFRHQHWNEKRARVRAILATAGSTARQLDAFDNCGSAAVVEWCDETKSYRIKSNHCKNRHCEPCARAKANLLAANLRRKLETNTQTQYRFITLTLKHTATPLTDQIKRLYRAFRSLRQTEFWKKSQTGGAAILEVKWSPTSQQWHPHLHIVAEGRTLRHTTLSSEWLRITGDSKIVDVRTLRDSKDAAHYVAKYVSKGTTDQVWLNPDAAQEWVTATRGLRTAATYGSWRGLKLLERLPDRHTYRRIATLCNIYRQARHGALWARQCLRALYERCQYAPHRPRGHHDGT